jgi:hypothetical protein
MDPKSDEAYASAKQIAERFLSAIPVEHVWHIKNVPWYEAPVRVWCLLGLHRSQTIAIEPKGYIERCACGAIRDSGSPWARLDSFPWRRLFLRH